MQLPGMPVIIRPAMALQSSAVASSYPGYPFPDEGEYDDPTVPNPYNPCPGGFCKLAGEGARSGADALR